MAPFDELADPRLLAELARAAESVGWDGVFLWEGFRPLPLQRPRIPVWVAASWPNRRPVRRAVRWEAAGATWVLTSLDPQPPEPEVRAVIDAGP